MIFQLKGENIKLGQLLKACSLVDSGAMAKDLIQAGDVKVNGQVCTQRGHKIVRGDKVELDSQTVEIE